MSEQHTQAEPPAPTTWLTAEQQEAWLSLISLVTRLPAALDTQLQRDSALTHFEYFVLSALSDAPDRKLQLSALAQRANASLSRLSHVVTKLEKVGWVRREVIPGSRGSNAVLTDEGMATVAEAAPGHVNLVQALIFEGLDNNQVAQLSELSTAMLTQLDKGIEAGLGKA
ncbi:MarR family winged helix-turn-helix transcriptional regulator [Rhodococcus sp. OK302]|uniref:MarR family winged helix-turn-helix transcriptional regulator n=1 Tax=Rhodococcus sp. OK302 TaxID=1882769 RepID=UPI000B93DDEB|nr:MarR family transcriptional regulator [Rhodococcus sp. OK302]OYD70629.1 DNA-binding MarR family transcriptional regulator [Rhodococcus sp. OK302]